MSDSLLDMLLAEQLDAVVFVMDYLQLDFGGARFTMYVWPTVTVGAAALHLGDAGYRDALCAFIGHDVTSVQESAESGLVIRWASGHLIVNPLPTEMHGPEIAMLQIHEGPFREASLAIWRPGEDVFADRDWS